MKVFLNPGHKPGLDPGAVHYNAEGQVDKTEAETALAVGEQVKFHLENVGYEVELLQSNSLNGEDEDEDNPSICRTANESGADIFVSIHCNACGSHEARGTEVEVYGFGGMSALLARDIQNQIIGAIDTVSRGVKARTDLCVLRNTEMPAVLIEMAFIDNDEDCQLLVENEDAFARAIARGITDYANDIQG